MKLRSINVSETGLVRENNEDYVWNDDSLWLVADGMGGHAAGEVASRMAVETVKANIGLGLEQAIRDAHTTITAAMKSDSSLEGMGTTIVAARLVFRTIQIAWVGDSRIYRWWPDGKIQQVTVDHSFVQEMVKRGTISQDQAEDHPQKNLLTQSLGMMDKRGPRVDSLSIKPRRRGGLLMCTDGVSDMLQLSRIGQIIANDASLDEKASSLNQAILDAGAFDNFSYILLDWKRLWPF